jgi:sulfur dioxygenase
MQTLHQLFDPTSSTFTYVLVDVVSRSAVIIDPVAEQLARDLELLRTEQLQLAYVLETHNHADHITSAGHLSQLTGALSAAPSGCGITAAQRQLADGDTLAFGSEVLTALHTPGHTAGSMSYLWRDCVFTGDCLLIDGCGRSDFQSGDAGALYDSITQRLFTLPDATRVYPAHDYQGRRVSSIGHERLHNSRTAGRTREQFVELMASLQLPRPRLMDLAVPANKRLGLMQA